MHKQFLTEYWKLRAPAIDGWTFYSARQPSQNIDGLNIQIGGETFRFLEFWLSAFPNAETEKIDLVAWHPFFDKLPEDQRWTLLFLVLDEALGETGTQTWIGKISLSDKSLTEAFPLRELPAFIRQTESETGWKKHPPTEIWSGYHLDPLDGQFRRSDIIAGTSNNMMLMNEFLGSEDHFEDPLARTGAEYVFVQIPSEFFPRGEEVAIRGQMEDALEQKLSSCRSGRHLGGALGTRYAYIDLLLFDGRNSLEIVRDELKKHSLPAGASIEYFAESKRGCRICL